MEHRDVRPAVYWMDACRKPAERQVVYMAPFGTWWGLVGLARKSSRRRAPEEELLRLLTLENQDSETPRPYCIFAARTPVAATVARMRRSAIVVVALAAAGCSKPASSVPSVPPTATPEPVDATNAAAQTSEPTTSSEGDPAVVRVGKSAVIGTIDKVEIRRVIREHFDEVRSCYQPYLDEDSTLGGRVLLDYEIEATGEVAWATVQSTTIAEPAVAECIADALESWRFPELRGGGKARVTTPLLLAPPDSHPAAR